MKRTRSSSRALRPGPLQTGPKTERALLLLATHWSLRQYRTKATEWSWTRRFSAIRGLRRGFLAGDARSR